MKSLAALRIVFLVFIIIGAVFRIMHFPFGFELLLVGVLGFLVVMIVQLVGKKK
jgi:hypothetical protein